METTNLERATQLEKELLRLNKEENDRLISELREKILIHAKTHAKAGKVEWFGNFRYTMNEDCSYFKKGTDIEFVTSKTGNAAVYPLYDCPAKYIREALALEL